MVDLFDFIASSIMLVILSLVAVISILINVATVQSPIIGVIAFSVYVIALGRILGGSFFSDDEEVFTRFLYGVFVLICFLILIATPLTILYVLNVITLAIVLSTPLIVSIAYTKLKGQDQKKSGYKGKSTNDAPANFSPLFVIPMVLIAFSEFLLVQARSGWVIGTVWDVVSQPFFYVYFLATATLVAVVLYSRTNASSKMLIVLTFSLVSITILAVVIYPGNEGDPTSHMGTARIIVDYGTLRWIPTLSQLNPWVIYALLKERALGLLTAIIAKSSVIDVYWIHTFITPVFSGIFIPLTSYKITKLISKEDKVSLLAAFLASFYSMFVIWGSISTGNSLGFASFFVSMYFSLLYLKSHNGKITLFLNGLTIIVTALLHPLTGVMALVVLFMAFSIRQYESIKLKSLRKAHFILAASFIIGVLAIPAAFSLNNIIYLYFASPILRALYEKEIIAFSVEKFLKTDAWGWVFGEVFFYRANWTFKDLVLLGSVPFLGMLGLAYALKKESKYSRSSVLFMLFIFMISLIDYRLFEYAMVNVPFGPARVCMFGYLVAIPFVAITIISALNFLEGEVSEKIKMPSFVNRIVSELSARRVLAGVLVVLALSAFAVSSIYRTYSVMGGGLWPTQLEVDAIKYIDEHTDERYVVFAMPHTAAIADGFVGWLNPAKFYVYSSELGQLPSVKDMVDYMKRYGAGIGYYIALSFGTLNFEKTIAEASRTFGLFKVLSNEHGVVYIFQYKIPPLPTSPEVKAFYWDTPPGYMVQNDLMRVIFNPTTRTLDVVDYWGELYESLDLNKALVAEKSLGNFTSIEYYSFQNDMWVKWDPLQEISSAQQFKFRLVFENDFLVGIVERGRSFVQLWWGNNQESTLNLQVGDFTRTYIPGLVGGANSYNVTSMEYGLLYTVSRTAGITLHPARAYDINTTSLAYDQIARYCDLNETEGYLWYDLFVQNNANFDQWAYIEAWLPDEIYGGIAPSVSYSRDDGKTWISGGSVQTLSGVDIKWVVTLPRSTTEKPTTWYDITSGTGFPYVLPEKFTDSGGAQNRLIYGFYMPAGETALVKLTFSIYNSKPLKITYLFKDSNDITFGLRNMIKSSVKLYSYGGSKYVGGFNSTQIPASLAITQDETGKIKSMIVTIPPNTTFSLLSGKGLDTTIDSDGNGIPDSVERL